MGAKGPFSTAGAQQISQALPCAIFAGDILIRSHPDDEGNILLTQESQPVKADELTVRQETLDAFGPEQAQITFDQCNALFGVAVARLAQNRPDQRDTIAARGNGKNQQVDLFTPDPPVRAIKAQVPASGEPEHPDHKARRPIFPRINILEETLQSAAGAFNLGLRWHLAADVAQIDRSNAGNADHQKAERFKAAIAQRQTLG